MQTVANHHQNRAAQFETEAMPHFSILKRFALHLARNRTEAEDLVQETYAAALKSFDRYEKGTNCRAWLCGIMFNKRKQWIRANSRYSQLDENQAQLPAVTAANSGAGLPPSFVGKTLSRALSALPKKSREIVWLSEVEEFTYREIAERLEIPIGTVMSRLHRGRRMLRVKFDLYAGVFSDSKKTN